MSSLKNKKLKANNFSLPKPLHQGSRPPSTDNEQTFKLIRGDLCERNIMGGKKNFLFFLNNPKEMVVSKREL